MRLETKVGLSTQPAAASMSPMARARHKSARARRLRGGHSGSPSRARRARRPLPGFYAPAIAGRQSGPGAGARRVLRLDCRRKFSTSGTLERDIFQQPFRNAIDFDPVRRRCWSTAIGVDTEGFELAGRVGFSGQWKLDASVTQAKSRVASTSNELRNRPESARWRDRPRAGRRSRRSSSTASATYVCALDSSIASR